MARPKKIQPDADRGNAPENADLAARADGEIAENASMPSPGILPINTGSRASFTLTPRGTVAWDRVQEKSKAQLRVIVSDPEFASQVGVAAPAVTGAQAGPMFDDATLGLVIGQLSRIKVQAAQAAGYPAHIAQIEAYTPDEAKRLGDRGTAVLNRYAAPYLGKHPELVMFVTELATVEISKVLLMRQTFANEQARGGQGHPPAAESPSNVVGVQ